MNIQVGKSVPIAQNGIIATINIIKTALTIPRYFPIMLSCSSVI